LKAIAQAVKDKNWWGILGIGLSQEEEKLWSLVPDPAIMDQAPANQGTFNNMCRAMAAASHGVCRVAAAMTGAWQNSFNFWAGSGFGHGIIGGLGGPGNPISNTAAGGPPISIRHKTGELQDASDLGNVAADQCDLDYAIKRNSCSQGGTTPQLPVVF
jgi:hypothetical protein